MEQPRRRGHAHQRGHLGAAARLAVDHHPVGIAAEIGDVVANPAQRRDQVGHADVDRIGISRPADLGQIEESEDIEAVIDRHLDDIMMPRHLRSFVRGQLIGRAEAETAAMKIDHHRTLAGEAGRPDVELEHVFALVAVVPILDERLFNRTPHGVALALLGEGAIPAMQVLRAIRSVDQRGIFAVPGLGRFGRQPPVLAARVLAIGYSFEREDVAIHKTAHLAILRVRDRLARRGAVSRLLMRGGLDAVGRAGCSRQRGAQARGSAKLQRLAAIELEVTLRICI